MKPTLIIMAAGMGSRFGGLKQMTPIDDAGQVILDYSAYDAVRAGFGKIICVIKKEMQADFRAAVGNRLAQKCDLTYAFQSLNDLPAGHTVPAGRVKPWGTAHAVRACRNLIDAPFAVVNADDFYGRGAFEALADFLSNDGPQNLQCLVGYRLRSCLTDNGTVARGICTADEKGHLLTVTERTKIQGPADHPSYTEDGKTWVDLDPDSLVSLNTWGFREDFLDAIDRAFIGFLDRDLPANPEKAEFFLPGVVNARLAAGNDQVKVLPTNETWHGLTYKDDLPAMRAAVAEMQRSGLYPARLWA
jgi:dTDP-glucose pyrophosphorylase